MNTRSIKKWICILCLSFETFHLYAQKHDYNYLNRSTPHGSGVLINYADSLENINFDIFNWNGTVSGSPVLSDKDGNFLGYFNSRNLYDSIGRIAINGDNMSVGYFQNYLFNILPEHEGLGNGGNAAFIPISDSLYYLFYKSSELWTGAPDFAITFEEKGKRLTSYSEGLYLTKVRLNSNKRLYINNEEKHILLVDDLFQYKNLMFCKHANGIDWWLLVPKALDDKAYRLLIYSNGEIEIKGTVEFSDNYWRVRSTSEFAFSPDGRFLARLIVRPDTLFKHIFEFFSFDRCDGTFHRLLLDSIPLAEVYTSGGDIEFSENGKLLYVALGSIILQMNLDLPNYFLNRDTIAEWDGFLYLGFLQPIFDALWRLPNGKILVASGVSTPFLHYVNNPNILGSACEFLQRVIELPEDPLNEPYGVDLEALPRFPPFRMKALDSPCTTGIEENSLDDSINIFPNPTKDYITVIGTEGYELQLVNIEGKVLKPLVLSSKTNKYQMWIGNLIPGMYFLKFINTDNKHIILRKIIKN